MDKRLIEQYDNAMYVLSHNEEANKVAHDYYNELPPNFREITEKEFAQSHFFTYGFERFENRQCFRDADGKDLDRMIEVDLFFMFDKTGYAMERDFWAGTIKYYKFGCQHNYEQLSQDECHKRKIMHFGMCYHVYECSECGHIQAVDSSD